MNSVQQKFWLLLLPVLAWFYIGLFATLLFWYPTGLPFGLWQDHVINFTAVYVIWLLVFFIYTLFDQATFRSSIVMVPRFLATVVTCGVVAIIYFYFQPELLLTPRRFLLVHMVISFGGISLWYLWVQYLLPSIWQRHLYLHPELFVNQSHQEIERFITSNKTLGWKLAGKLENLSPLYSERATVVLPAALNLQQEQLAELFELKRKGVEFLEHSEFFELTQRIVHLSGLNEVWFLRSINYRQRIFDIAKRCIDIIISLFGLIILAIAYPVAAGIIKSSSKGPIIFSQNRIGQYGKVFTVYKFRTMAVGVGNTWTLDHDQRITSSGKWLRKLRLDELPQFVNILIGNMSLVGPRPEQVHIVEHLKTQIPYYNERHMVKPGLTGWSQLHVYANSVEDTKRKLQYDLYYIKHRSLWLDMEIILRTIFHIITFQGK